MPFTFAHPAIILPLTFLPPRWFSLTGLVIGSLTPDFEYFLRMKIQSDYSHTVSGLFWFNIPLGILLAFTFHTIVRDSLFDNLPAIASARFSKFKQFNWNSYFRNNWLVVIISILTGAASHIVWDSFTHDHGYFVQKIPLLANTAEFFGTPVPILKILQHISTLSGILVIAFVLFKITPDKNVTGQSDTTYCAILITITLTIIAIRLFCGLDYKSYGHVIVTAISASMISLTLAPWLTKVVKKN